MQGLSAPHPRLRPDAAHPVGEARDEAEVLNDVLLADKSDWNLSARRYRQRHAEEALGHEDALGVVSQRPVPDVRGDALGLVEKAVEGDVVVRLTTLAA